MNTLPGWTKKVDEISNGVYKVIFQDTYGRTVEAIDSNFEETLTTAISYAFDIEKQVSTNWNRFLYDLTLDTLISEDLTLSEYDDATNEQWLIQIENERIIYNDKDLRLTLQVYSKDHWIDKTVLKKEGLTYQIFLSTIYSIAKHYT